MFLLVQQLQMSSILPDLDGTNRCNSKFNRKNDGKLFLEFLDFIIIPFYFRLCFFFWLLLLINLSFSVDMRCWLRYIGIFREVFLEEHPQLKRIQPFGGIFKHE